MMANNTKLESAAACWPEDFDGYDADGDDRELANTILELFSPRTDVVAQHFEGSKGWYTMCDNYRILNLCKKPGNKNYPCKECSNRTNTKLTVELLQKHVAGDIYLGIFPLLLDNTCKFIVADFDNHDPVKNLNPYQDIVELYNVCEVNEIPCYVVKSKSGKGYHVYIFFDKPVQAWKARIVINALLREAQLLGEEGLYSSFDQLRPNQDSLVDGKIGNAISLPFQGGKVNDGITVFLDPDTNFEQPYENQLDVLNSIQLSSEADLDRIIDEWGLEKVKIDDKAIVRTDDETLEDKIEALCKCDFLKHCYDNQTTISETEWWMMISNVVRMDLGGPKLCHMFSNRDARRYSNAETEKQILEALDRSKPHTCNYIKENGYNCTKDCGVTSPIVLAKRLLNNNSKTVLADKIDFSELACDDDEVAMFKQLVIPKRWILNDKLQVLEYQKNKKEKKGIHITILPQPVIITKKVVSAQTGQEQLEVAWLRNGKWKRKIIDRSVAAKPRELVNLADDGFPIDALTARSIVRYLTAFQVANENNLQTINSTSNLGWQPSKKSFMWGTTDISVCSTDSYGQNKVSSTQVIFRPRNVGDQQVADSFCSSGSYEQWIEAVNKVMDYPFAAAALYISLSTPFIEILDAPNLIADWSNPTSTGKTTLLKLAASVWGNPNMSSGCSVINSWNSTSANIGFLAGLLNGLPLILDDTKTANINKNMRDNGANIIQKIYELHSGQGRGRGTPTGTAQKGFYRTCVMSTGEQPITEFTNGDGGARARTLSFWAPPFGKTDESTGEVVNLLKNAIGSNYGHAGPKLIRYILANKDKWNDWKMTMQKIRQEYTVKYVDDGITSRFSEYFAFLATTIQIIHEALPELNRKSSCNELLDSLWNIAISEGKTADRATAAFEEMLSFAAANQSKFWNKYADGTQQREPIQGWYGRWDSNGTDSKIYFREKILVDMLSESNYDSSAVINTWIDRGWIERGKNEKKINRRINGSQIKCYCIDPHAFNNDSIGQLETLENPNFSSTTNNKIKDKCSNIDWDE